MKEFDRNKAHLINLIDDLFGKDLTDAEFIEHDKILGELESCMVEDGRLTWDEIIEIHESWTRKAA